MNIIRFGKKNWPILIIICLWLLFSSPYFFKGLVPFPSRYLATFFPPWSASYGMPVKNNAMPDIITQIYPWKKFTIETWKNGQIPLWNPNSFSGTPHAANYQSAVFTPFNVLFIVLPFIDGWSVVVLLQPLLAGFFMYILLREFSCRRSSSVIGGVGFMFCGFMTVWMAYATLGYACLFLPLLFYSILKFFHSGSKVAFFLVFVSTSLSLLSGHFQISVYVLMLSLCFLLFLTFTTKKFTRAIFLGIGMVLGIMAASPQLFLTYDAFTSSVRATNTQIKEIIPWHYIVTFFSPDFFGNPVTRNDWFGHYAEWAGYIGVIPLLLSIYGICFSRKNEKIFFLTASSVVLLMAYSSPLSSAIFSFKIPVLSTSGASRIIVLLSFCLCILSSFGMDTLRQDWKKRIQKKHIVYGITVGMCCLLLWGVLYILKPIPPEWILVAKRNLILPTALLFGALGVMILGFTKIPYRIIAAIFFLICLACFDSYRYATKWMPFEEKSYVYPENKVISFLQKTVGNERVFGGLGNEVGSTYDIPLIEGYDAMYQGRYGEFINALSNGIVSEPGRSVVVFDKFGRYAKEGLELLGVRYIVHRKSDGRNVWAFPFWQYPESEMKKIFEDEHYEVYEYTKAYPKASLFSSYVIVDDDQKIIDTLFQKDFDRKNILVLETKPAIEPEMGEAKADVTVYTPTVVSITTTSPVPKLLFVPDVYDGGWKATVDGKPAEVLRADYDFRAVALNGGDHVVEFRYHPQSFRVGIILSGLSLLGVFICIILMP